MNRDRPRIPALSRRAALVGAAQAAVLLAAACAAPQARPSPASLETAPASGAISEPTAPLQTPAQSPTAPPAVTPAAPSLAAVDQGQGCRGSLAAVVRPTPIPYPGYTEEEPSTGLHVTAKPQIVDLETYRLAVKGLVAKELSLTYDELRCLPKIRGLVRIECPGYFVDESNLAGAALASVLALAGPLESAQRVEFRGVDGWTNSRPLADVQGTGYFLAYEWEGEPLPVSHGFPVRAALPGHTGALWTKWLQEIRLV